MTLTIAGRFTGGRRTAGAFRVVSPQNPATGTLALSKVGVSGSARSLNPGVGSIHIRRPSISGVVGPSIPTVGTLILRRPRVIGDAIPPTLYAAIKFRFDTWPDLAASFPGGFRQDRMKDGTQKPNLVYNIITSASKRNMGRGYFDVIDLRFICYGDNSEQAEALGKRVKAAYLDPDSPLAFSDGYLMSFLGTGDLGPIENPASSGNKQFWSKAVQVRAKVGRNGP